LEYRHTKKNKNLASIGSGFLLSICDIGREQNIFGNKQNNTAQNLYSILQN